MIAVVPPQLDVPPPADASIHLLLALLNVVALALIVTYLEGRGPSRSRSAADDELGPGKVVDRRYRSR